MPKWTKNVLPPFSKKMITPRHTYLVEWSFLLDRGSTKYARASLLLVRIDLPTWKPIRLFIGKLLFVL